MNLHVTHNSKSSTTGSSTASLQHIDAELEEIINKRTSESDKKIFVVGTGITSSHLGDERNLREFLFANEVTYYLRHHNQNVLFILIDDSYDPLNFRQLRVGVNKNAALIDKFEKYCGMPIAFIPDPYECHKSYSSHYQQEILDRFRSVGIYPNIIDTYSSYESGIYDFAKEIVFSRYKELIHFLKEKFPSYTMKKVFYPVCPDCRMMEGIELGEITGSKVHIYCNHCKKSSSHSWKHLKGKFNWKVDAAIKWNIYKTDFEPFSKAYLDPTAGSYYIAKALSEQFFGGKYPDVIHYGQVLMDKRFSLTLLKSLPSPAFRMLYLQRRKTDIHISEQQIIHIAKQHLIEKDLTYYDYLLARLPYDLLEHLNGQLNDPFWQKLLHHGLEFNRNFLKREMLPQLPTIDAIKILDTQTISQIRSLILWALSLRRQYKHTFTEFSTHYQTYLSEHKIQKSILFPVLRKLLVQEHGVPLRRLLYFAPYHYLYACLALLDEAKEIITQEAQG